MGKLTESKIISMKSGTISDGGGLYIIVTKAGVKRFLFRWTDRRGKESESGNRGKAAKMSLGPFKKASEVGYGLTLVQARHKAAELQQLIYEGGDPRQVKKIQELIDYTFGEAAEKYLEAHNSALTNDKHRAQWRTTLMGGGKAQDYCKSLRKIMIADVTMQDVMRVLKPIWMDKNVTASRIRGRIERVLDFATVQGWRHGDNPARWQGNLEHVLSKRLKLQRGHFAAMPYAEVPEFYKSLHIDLSAGAACLAWTILTAVRSGEARKATWDEIEINERLWIIPADRMKMDREHRVPLSAGAMDILEIRAREGREGLIFAGKGGKVLSDMTLTNHMRRRQLPYTVHGFRSSFRDWAAEHSGHSWDVIETALAHKVGSAVAQAYMRTDLLDKRRDLMRMWEAHVVF